ncbi:hypothetical protein HDV64DRAFT_249821 [Trichoderma sp. TUCIM 5745]
MLTAYDWTQLHQNQPIFPGRLLSLLLFAVICVLQAESNCNLAIVLPVTRSNDASPISTPRWPNPILSSSSTIGERKKFHLLVFCHQRNGDELRKVLANTILMGK